MRRTIFDIVLDVILLLLAILVIYWLTQLILGGSPDLSQFNVALIIMIGGFLVKIYREIGEIKVGIRYSFSNVKKDSDLIKDDLILIKKKLKI